MSLTNANDARLFNIRERHRTAVEALRKIAAGNVHPDDLERFAHKAFMEATDYCPSCGCTDDDLTDNCSVCGGWGRVCG